MPHRRGGSPRPGANLQPVPAARQVAEAAVLLLSRRGPCITMWCMAKSEVYSWRLAPHLKADLEAAARAEQKSVAELLDQIARQWLAGLEGHGEDGQERQRRLREAARKSIGALLGGNPDRAANAGTEVRARIARRHAR